MKEKLLTELDGILMWALEGCQQWQIEGLSVPEEVKAATDGYRAEMDTLGGFIADCCIVAENARAATGVLYSAYLTWAQKSGEDAISKTAFGLKLEERGFTPGRSSFGRFWCGIGLVATESGEEV